MKYFTSDEHYGSARTLKLSKRPFKSVSDMDEVLVSLFNETVEEYDEIWHLGDFGDFENLQYLPGFHYLVLGNYEMEECKKKFKGEFDKYREYLMMEIGFVDVFMDKKYLKVNDELMFKLIHEPSKHDDILVNNELQVFNLFGHIHGRQMIRRYGIDVGVDAHHFRPISLNRVLFYKEAIEKHYDSEVFE